MKKTIVMFVLILSGFSISAQTKDEKAVAAAVEQLRKAMVDADSAMLDILTLSKLSYGHSSGKIQDKETFINSIITGKSVFVTLELPDQTISISKNVAIVRHKFNAVTNDSGKPGEVHLAIILIWQKLHGDWKLLARQAVKVQ